MSLANPLGAKYVGKTVIGVGAHPGDLEIGAGGTLARLAREGARVLAVVVCVPAELERRREEARRAAELLGCELEILYGEGSRRVEDLKVYELVGRLDRLVESRKPAAIISHAVNHYHRDHGLVYNACLSAQRLSFHDFFCFHPTSLHPVQVPFFPQAFVDISPTIDAKMRAIAEHGSQLLDRGIDVEHYKIAAREYGRLAGVEYAEGLEVVRMMLP